MKCTGYILLTTLFLTCFACSYKAGETPVESDIDKLNQEAFDLRYKDIAASRSKAAEALRLVGENAPGYYDAQAQAWNHIAYSCFLSSYFDSTRYYLDKVRAIEADYPNKEIEEAITYITEARLFLRECKYAEAFIIYDSTITIFSGLFNRLKYNDRMPLKRYDHNRYNWAKSDYLIGNAVLGYYYRDTELPIILRSLDKIKKESSLHVDTTQLSILYYTYAGSYEKAVSADVDNFYLAFDNVKKGLDLLEDPASRNDYHLANFYQISGSLMLDRGTRKWMSGPDSLDIKAYFDDFKREYLIGKYGWSASQVGSDSLPLMLLRRADSIFEQYDDPYQNLASCIHIGNYYRRRNNTAEAWEYYSRGIANDSIITARGGHARMWKKYLYETLLKNVPPELAAPRVRDWFDIYSTESAAIAENTKLDYNAQRGKMEAENSAKKWLSFAFLILSVCATVIVLLYFLNRQNKKLKKARSVLGIRNDELEENRSDLESLVKIGKHVVSTLEIDDDSTKTHFIDGIYRQIRELRVLAALPDLSFILYLHTDGNRLQRYCKEAADSNVDVSFHPLTELQRPAVGCFLKYGREVLSFDDWNTEYSAYAEKVGIDSALIDPDRTISGNPTRSLAFINLYNKEGDKIGVLSFQTTQLGAFRNPSLLASFEIIAEYIAAALDNAMQYKTLHFVQKKLIEQKRMELLTYVVRGISHELSQPLGSITQTLYDTFRDIDRLDGAKESLSVQEYEYIVRNINADLVTISQSKDAISDLVNSFRNTIRENIIDPETEFDLCGRLDDIVKVIKPNIKSNINLVVDCEGEMVIRSFPLLFSQVITNLISNANQHAFPDSDSSDDTVSIICRASGRDLIIKCTDNGIGIPEDELDKLCQPFVSKKQANLGLGLSLVKNIVEQYMKGEISFSSDDGLTVTVVIPDCIIKK